MFEDDDIIVVVKPAGILTIGGSGESRLSMLDMVKSYLKTKRDRKDKAFAVHRLDREVSGLLLIAKNEKTKAKFITNWKDSHKLYRALVHGKMTTASGTLKDYITEGAKQKMVVVDTPKNDKNDKIQLAVLSYEVIKEIDEYTLLNINIQTGRKNQIRVQMSNAGHPIVGDRRYGDTDKFERQIRLQAYHLEFKHPSTKENLSFEIAMPKHFLEIRNMDENYKQQINKNYRKK
jgi:RluA family pseudouridine synthase